MADNGSKTDSGKRAKQKSVHVFFFSLIALFLGTFLSLVLAEFAIRLFSPQELVSDIILSDPDVDYRLRPNARGWMSKPEYSKEIRVNFLGFRGKEVALTKKPEVKRVLFLGDSFTFGSGLGEDETLPSLVGQELEQRQPGGFEVVNGGVYGYSTANGLELFMKYGLPLRPDIVVILVMIPDDMIQNTEWYELIGDGQLKRKQITSQYVESRRITKYIPGAAWLRENSHLFKFVGIRVLPVLKSGGVLIQDSKEGVIVDEHSPEFYHDERGAFRITTALLTKLAKVSKENGAKSVLLTLGGAAETEGGNVSSRRMIPHKKLITAALDGGFSDAVALPPILVTYKGNENLFYPLDGHWTVAATRFVAPPVADIITQVSVQP